MKELLIALNHRPISYYPIYAKMLHSANAGILLSQLMYWWSAVHGREFYKTDAEIIEETCLTAGELRSAKQRLKESKFVTIKAKGVPARTHYHINYEFLQTSLAEFAKLDSLKSQNLLSDFNETITENTQRIQQREKGAEAPEPICETKNVPDFCAEVVAYLNTAANREFRSTTVATRKAINARLKDGYTLEDFKEVIDDRVKAWGADEKMREYLRPETLFTPSHFESYLNSAKATPKANTDTALNDIQLDPDTATKYAAYITHAQAQYPALWSSAVRVLSHSEFQDYMQNKSIPAVQYGLTPKEKRSLLLKVHEQLNASNDSRKKYSRTFDAYLTAARQALRQENVKI